MFMRPTVRTAAIFAAVAVAAVAAVANAGPAEESTARIQAQVDHGKSTYAQKCSHCHGPNMVNSGTVTPDLRTFPDDETRFVTTVKNGKNNKMPPWGDLLNDDDITDLWAFISSRRRP